MTAKRTDKIEPVFRPAFPRMLELFLGLFRADDAPPDEGGPGRARDLTPDEVGVPNPRVGFTGDALPEPQGDGPNAPVPDIGPDDLWP